MTLSTAVNILVFVILMMKIKDISSTRRKHSNHTFIRCHQYDGFLFECICPLKNTAWKLDGSNQGYILLCNPKGQLSFMKLFGDTFLFRSKRRKRSADVVKQTRHARSTDEYMIKCFINQDMTWYCKCPQSNVVLNLNNDEGLYIVCDANNTMLLMKSASIQDQENFAEKYEEEQEKAKPNVFPKLKDSSPQEKQYLHEHISEHPSGYNHDNTAKMENRTRNVNESEADKNNTQNNKQIPETVNEDTRTIEPKTTTEKETATPENKTVTPSKPTLTTKDRLLEEEEEENVLKLLKTAPVVKHVSVTANPKTITKKQITTTVKPTTTTRKPTTTTVKPTTTTRKPTTTTVKPTTTTRKPTTTTRKPTTTTVKQTTTTRKPTTRLFKPAYQEMYRKTIKQQNVIEKPPTTSASHYDLAGMVNTSLGNKERVTTTTTRKPTKPPAKEHFACTYRGKQLHLHESFTFMGCVYRCTGPWTVNRNC